MPRQSGRLIVVNTVANFVGRFWARLLALLVIPYLIRYLDEGGAGWSTYTIGLSVMALASMIGPGLQNGYIKVFAEFIARGRTADLRRLVAACLAIYAIFGLAFMAVAWVAADWMVSAARVADGYRTDARFLFLAFLAALCINNFFIVFRCMIVAYQRMPLVNALSVVIAVFHYTGVIVVMVCDWGLRGLGILFIVAALFQGFVLVLGQVRLPLRAPSSEAPAPVRSLLNYLFRYGIRMKIAGDCDAVVFHADKFFVTLFAGFHMVGVYAMGSVLALVLRDFVKLFVSALLPAAATLAAQGDDAVIRRVNRRASRWFFLASSPCFLFVAAMAPSVLYVWKGPSPAEASVVLALLSLAFYANTAVAASMELGAGRHLPHLHMASNLTMAAANIVLNLILGRLYGYVGIAAASIVSLTLGSGLYAWPLLRALKDRPGVFLVQTFFRPLFAGGVLALVLGWFGQEWIFDWIQNAHRLAGLAALGVSFVGFCGLYAATQVVLGQVGRDDVDFLKQHLRRDPLPDAGEPDS